VTEEKQRRRSGALSFFGRNILYDYNRMEKVAMLRFAVR
jgi:hypothetical protein